MKVWYIEGMHPYVPGIVRRVCATKERADTEATFLVDIIQVDVGIVGDGTWEERLKMLEGEYDDDEYYVFVEEMEVLE